MMKTIIPWLSMLLVLILGTTSCFKKDTKIEPHPADTTKVEMIAMKQFYNNQVYFNLLKGEQVSQNIKSDYDLLFSSADTGFLIRLNTASFMMAAATNKTSFDQVMDTTGLEWAFDPSSGNVDSTVFVDWIKILGTDTLFTQQVYVINRGLDAYGHNLGLRKIIFHSLKKDRYSFSYCQMDNTDRHDVVVEKDPGFNTIQFSFETNESLQTEPLTDDWDLLFTQYTTMLITDAGEDYPYLLTGVLINPSEVGVVFDTTMVFDEVTIDSVLYLNYSTKRDAIGYDWKELIGDINGGDIYYKCRPNYNYFIKTRTGVFFKLKFTNFYEPVTGEKGYPTFQYRRL
ncbi:MAG: HmuY family protein [Bacteroidales bacterium]|nr:HmuY family protein [Bacteroidales bacterium]